MNNQLNLIYQKLYNHFGPQHWWPADTSFEVMIGAILTQNTNWLNVEKALNNLKKHRLLKPDILYRISKRRLASLIKPAGYFNIKAKRLKAFLDFLFKSCQGSLKKMTKIDTQYLRSQLLSVNGIGPETADSILLYALDKPVFVVDVYTKRILLRHKLIREDANYDQIQDFFMKNLRKSACNLRKSALIKLFNEYHALLVRLGKEICLKNKPKCNICPLR